MVIQVCARSATPSLYINFDPKTLREICKTRVSVLKFPGQTRAHVFEYWRPNRFGVRVGSFFGLDLCEPISDEAFLGDFKWERKCPRVTWDKTTHAKFPPLSRVEENPPFMNITLMNPEPMNLWTGDRWNSSGIQKMKDGEIPSESDQNVGWDSKKNHLVHPNVEFVRIQWRKTGVGEWINAWDIDWSSWEDITMPRPKN